MATQDITITVTTPGGVTVASVLNDLCVFWHYSGVDTNPAKAAFVKQKLAAFFRDSYIAAKANADAEAARSAATTAAGQVGTS